MKRQTIAIIAAVSLLPLAGVSQTSPMPVPPAPPAAPGQPVQPVPPVPPVPPRGERGPKVPVTYLGVETSEVPRVVADQLGLPRGFGLVVDYVVPDGPAAAAGVQQNDILKMFNDQILMEPDQLSKLIRSQNEGTQVTLTVLRKGAETKLTAKLGKREVQERRWERHGRHGDDNAFLGPEFDEKMREFNREMGKMKFSAIDETVRNAREQARMARDEARRAMREARRQMQNGVRVMTSNEDGVMKTTRIDLGKAEIAYSDDKGEMRIQTLDGKKTLIAKDPQGRLQFSGPVTTKEELDKVPAEVRGRYEKLEQKDIPSIAPPNVTASDDDGDVDVDFDFDFNFDTDDGDKNNDNDNGSDVQTISVPLVPTQFPYRTLAPASVLI